MSLIFMDGFDDGMSAYKWTVGPSGYIAGRTGTTAALINTYINSPQWHQFQSTEKHATFIIGFAFAFNQATTRQTLTLYGDNGGTAHLSLYRTDDGRWQVYRGAGSVFLAQSNPNVFTVGPWYHFEGKFVLHDTTGRAIIKINGVTVIDFTGDTKNAGTDPTFDRLLFEQSSNANQLYIDDFFVLNGAGTVNNDFIGDCSIQTLYPNGNGNYSQFVGSDGNSTDNYLLVDETSANTSDYVASATSGEKDSYTFTDLGTGTVYGLAQRSYAAKSDAGIRLMRNFQRVGGTDYPSAVDQGLSITPTYQAKSDIVEVNPATSNLWTVSEVNGAEFGVEVR